jgi:uncharacterized phage protein (TIGR01671 family)
MIKFRAYNKVTKQVEEVKEIAFFKDDFVLNTRDLNTLKMQDQINSDEAVLLRFTGLFDKNKREIYEGDIIMTNGNPYTVEYVGSSPSLIKANGNFCEYMCNLFDMGGILYEIVGNIYENPELMEN